MIKATKTKLKNVLLFQLEPFKDRRGTYTQLFRDDEYSKIIKRQTGQNVRFVEDDYAYSVKNVLRGIHGDDRTWKLVTCLFGKFHIVVVNNDQKSKQFLEWQSFVLSRESFKQLLIPPNHGHGYLVLSKEAVFHYKQSCYYQGMKKQFTLKYNDPKLNIPWPIKNPILSKRDQLGQVPN